LNALGHVVARFAIATGLLASTYWVMYGPSGLPWIISTGLHIYAILALCFTALLIYQASSRALTATRG